MADSLVFETEPAYSPLFSRPKYHIWNSPAFWELFVGCINCEKAWHLKLLFYTEIEDAQLDIFEH